MYHIFWAFITIFFDNDDKKFTNLYTFMMTLIYCTSTPDDYCDIYFYRNKTLYKQFKKLFAKLFPFMRIKAESCILALNVLF